MFRHVWSVSVLAFLVSIAASAQEFETMVDAGGYRLHFHGVKGSGMPILFESGGGDDASVWKDLLEPVANVTVATLITYDRAGFGKSDAAPEHYSILQEVEGLEAGLAKLGYSGDIMLVAHSLGGFYATVYASRHPEHVKAAVLIDTNLACFFTDAHLASSKPSATKLAEAKAQGPGPYAVFLNAEANTRFMRTVVFPTQVPVTDIISEHTLFEGTPDAELWRDCHQQFDRESLNRKGITAYGSGHYIFLSHPELVVAAIANAYAGAMNGKDRAAVAERYLNDSLKAINRADQRESKRVHSEDDLNDWEYQLLKKGENQQAVEVFKLNVSLHPQSANTYDSLADAYVSLGEREKAIENYKHELLLNPTSTSAKKKIDYLLVSTP